MKLTDHLAQAQTQPDGEDVGSETLRRATADRAAAAAVAHSPADPMAPLKIRAQEALFARLGTRLYDSSLDDRQLDAILERLDRLNAELHILNSRLDQADGLLRVTHELRTLNESLQALAYAALGHQGPQVRRRRSG